MDTQFQSPLTSNEFLGGSGLAPSLNRSIREAIHRHHTYVRHMGGPLDQDLYDLYATWHINFHSRLGRALKEASGFPPVGGRGGSRDDWMAFLRSNKDKHRESIAILRRVTREFDRDYGTSMSGYLARELEKAGL